MNVTQLIGKNGKGIANQLIITDGDTVTFQSYDSKIATYNKVDKTLKLYGNLWDYSNTTRKYFMQFVNDFTIFNYSTKSEWLRTISNGKYLISIISQS